MFFLLTNFIYPLKKPLSLSSYFKFIFDNPRSKEEIEIIRRIIQKSWVLNGSDGSTFPRFPLEKEVPNQNVITFESMVHQFLQKHFGEKEANTQIKEIEGDEKAIVDFYVRHWVIVRYETKEMLKEDKKLQSSAKKMRERGDRGFFLLDEEHIFEKREKQLVDYSYIISLLSANDEYFGWNFLVTKTHQKSASFSINIDIMRNILHQTFGLSVRPDDSIAYELNFDVFFNFVVEKIKLLDERLNKKEIDEDILLYIGDILESAQPINNQFSSLVRLVSIIEMLLTHQPDFLRFNVEDSITRQFVLKTAILVHGENPKIDLRALKSKLKSIYTQRSNIVHGNFIAVNKFIKELKKQDEYFDSLIVDSYNFARTAIDLYIREPKFVQFLKEN